MGYAEFDVHAASFRWSRRKFIVAVGALAGSYGLADSASAIEPITCLQAAAAMVSIVSGIAGMASDAKLRDGIDEIIAKLDLVVANQEAILADLKALRLYIDEALLRSWRDAYARNIVSDNDLLDVYLTDLSRAGWMLDNRLRDDFEDLSRDANTVSLNIGQMDPWAFPSFCTGAAVVLVCERILKASPDRVRKVKEKYREVISKWIDANNPRSISREITKTADEIKTRTDALNARARSYVIRSNRVSDGGNADTGGCSVLVTETLTVSGTFDTGYTGAISRTESDRRCRPPRRHIPSSVLIDKAELNIEARIASRNPRIAATGISTNIPVVPGFTPSGYDIVDTFNRERIAIYELMAVHVRQQELASEMERMRKALL